MGYETELTQITGPSGKSFRVYEDASGNIQIETNGTYTTTGELIPSVRIDPVTGRIDIQGPQGAINNLQKAKITGLYKLGAQLGHGAGPVPSSNQQVWELPFDFDEVRIGILNTWDNATFPNGTYPNWTQSGINIAVASTEVLAQPVSGQSGSNQWQPISAGAASTSAFVQLTQAGSNTILPATYAGAKVQTNPPSFYNVTWTDWAKVSSIPRADGGSRPLLLIRTYLPAACSRATYFNGPAAADFSTLYANATGMSMVFNEQSGGSNTIGAGNWNNYGAGTVYDESNASSRSIIAPAYVIQARFRGNVLSVAAVGDSTVAGAAISSSSMAWFQNFLFQLSRSWAGSSKPILPINLGWAGMPAEDSVNSSAGHGSYLANFQYAVSQGLVPDVAVYLPFSVNDINYVFGNNYDASGVLSFVMSRAAEFVSTCQSNGIVPILMTAWPKPIGATTNDARGKSNTAIRAMANAGIMVLDVDAICGTGAATNRSWASGFSDDSPTYTHPNQAAHAAVAASLATLLSRVI